MKITEKELAHAMKAFIAAFPEGVVVHALSVCPRVGFADTEAGVVAALVLADTPEDFKRFEQVIQKGIAAYKDESGWMDHVLRTTDMEQRDRPAQFVPHA